MVRPPILPKGFRWCPECHGEAIISNPEYNPLDDATTQCIECERCQGEGVIERN